MWDPAIPDNFYTTGHPYQPYDIIKQYYRPNSLESVIWQPENSFDFRSNLATSWEFEYWPEETNLQGFVNTGGHKSVTLTLREGVTFHDGSNWNATVLKWNIDRAHLINGNYTGLATGSYEEEEGNLLGTMLVEDNKPYFTSTWNLSEYDSPNLGLTPPSTLPSVTDYASYDLGPNASLVEYSGVTILPNNTVQNPNPYGGWDTAAGAAIHWAPYDRFPAVKYVEIIENPASGGKVKVHFNSWNSEAFDGFVNNPMISYHSYKDDYTVHYIYGYDNDVKDPQNPTIVNHMIGTGPYIYVEHDETGTPPGGSIIKNLNYWNRTALEADGWFEADIVDIIKFPADEIGKDAINTAIQTNAIDYAIEDSVLRFNYDAIIANPNINYIENGVSDYITEITLNRINETWWAWPPLDVWRQSFYPLAGNQTAGGVPQAMREAISYAFNYDYYINTVLDGRAVRAGALGVDNVYYNTSTPITDYNITRAREILLTTGTDTSGEVYTAMNLIYSYNPDPDLYNFSKMCANRGLDENSTDADWQLIADTNPIFTLNFYWDSDNQDVQSVLLQSLKNIGCTLKDEIGTTNKVSTIIWDTVHIGHLTTFDGEYGLFSANAWVMDYHMPITELEQNVYWHYGDPDEGRWRTLGMGGITSWHYWGNYGFSFNEEVDYWINQLLVSSMTKKQELLNNITEKVQTELCSDIYISQIKEGLALWNDWDMNLNRGPVFFANFGPPPGPGDFVLSSDAGTPDIDGNFNLIWNVSLGADNYSIYMYNNVITQINGSLTTMANQNATSPFAITGLSSDKYYFVVVAHNQYGDTMSNNVYVTVQIPPGSFVLSSDADFPDDDGIFNLIWTTSDWADNYSIYMHNNVITQINGSLTTIANQNATSPFAITGLSSDEYYFVVVAHNQYGDTMSNNMHITVQIQPGSFVLSSDADFPDDDGIFNLIWTTSEWADNYSIYMHNNVITQINGSLTTMANQNATSPFAIIGLSSDEYYFVVVAHNQYGDITSNNIHITVQIPPNSFVLSSDADFPDDDGIFNLIWTTSDEADNYSLYVYINLITQINGSLTTISNQNATSPFAITGLSSDEYYFVVVAHNQYGDTISNNIHITVQIPPVSFVLSSDADFPDDDGILNLIWTTSEWADNYSIYMHNNVITQINGSLTLITTQDAVSPFAITGLSSSEYYFVVVAHNQYGDIMSNNIHVTVQIPPGSFVLNSNADFPDDDGIFNLFWTTSEWADNYSIYMYNTPITVINNSLTLLLDQIATSAFTVSGLPTGEYYFVIVAYNQYGDIMSNNLYVVVIIPGGPTPPGISGYNTLVILGIVIFIAVILFKRKKLKYKLR